MRKIKVLIKEPGKKPRCVNVSDRLENLQKIVGGNIETFKFASDATIICNEEGKLQGLPYNCYICGNHFFGTIILCGVSRDEFCDIPIGYSEIKKGFSRLWEEQ